MEPVNERLKKKLADRNATDSLRVLPGERKDYIDFTSNDYLGLARSSDLYNLIRRNSETYSDHFNGSTGSRLLTGDTDYARRLEEELATRFQGEKALLFNSGYTANLGVISAIASRDDTLLYDERAHACIKDGARLSLGSRFAFRHNDLNDLESKLRKVKGNSFIVVESLYSMDGDHCPIGELTELADKYGSNIIIDEAHSTGLGERGAGYAVKEGKHTEMRARIYTFGKAMGVHGAVVVGDNEVIDYLVNFSRQFIYTTALPYHSLVSIRSAFEFLDGRPELETELNANIEYYLNRLEEGGIGPGTSRSAIQPLIIPGNKEVKERAKLLAEAGIDVRAVLSPTVKEGTERLRICIHSFNSKEEIDLLVNTLR